MKWNVPLLGEESTDSKMTIYILKSVKINGLV